MERDEHEEHDEQQTQNNRKTKHVFNHAKLRILYAINYLVSSGNQASGSNILKLLPDYSSNGVRARLLHYYLRGYIKRTVIPKRKVNVKKTMSGWSTRESFKYDLTEKGVRCLGNMLYRYSHGLDLNLLNTNPKKINYFEHWTKEELERSKISLPKEDLENIIKRDE